MKSSTKSPGTYLSALLDFLDNVVEQVEDRSSLPAAAIPQIVGEDSRQFFSADCWPQWHAFLRKHTDENGHFRHTILWEALFQELRAAADLQATLKDKNNKQDPFQEYAAIYDAVIGQPCMDHFMKNYLRHFSVRIGGLSAKKILSLGCGTGMVETFLLRELNAQRSQLLGIDISAGMIREARKRIPARQQDLLTMDANLEKWQLVYSGLNVFHYLPVGKMESAVQKTAELLEEDGCFLGDFISSDHIRWYPNVIISEDESVVSLRDPALMEVAGAMFQESEIFNLYQKDGELHIHYAGKHRRCLPPLHRIRTYFEKYFREVQLYDAYSLEELPEQVDTCASTRYVVLARK